MYTTTNFKSKKALKEAVAAWNDYQAKLAEGKWDATAVKPVTIYAPGLGTPKRNGMEFVEGPHYPQPHKWYAQVEMKDGFIIKVK